MTGQIVATKQKILNELELTGEQKLTAQQKAEIGLKLDETAKQLEKLEKVISKKILRAFSSAVASVTMFSGLGAVLHIFTNIAWNVVAHQADIFEKAGNLFNLKDGVLNKLYNPQAFWCDELEESLLKQAHSNEEESLLKQELSYEIACDVIDLINQRLATDVAHYSSVQSTFADIYGTATGTAFSTLIPFGGFFRAIPEIILTTAGGTVATAVEASFSSLFRPELR